MGFSGKNKAYERRQLLRSLGLAGAASFLPSLRPSRAAAGSIPKRLVIFYTKHGTLPWLWRPTVSGNTITLPELLKPLEPYKEQLTLLGGVDFRALDKGTNSAACGHARANSSALTAQTQIVNKLLMQGNGPSIDVFIANGLKTANGGVQPTRFPYLHAGITHQGGTDLPFQSGPALTIPINSNPNSLRMKMFPDGTVPVSSTSGSGDIKMRNRSKMMRAVADEYRVVADRFGQFEKQRLEQHHQLVADLATYFENQGKHGGGAISAACKYPSDIPASGTGINQWDLTTAAVPKLLQAALACDLTRCFGISVGEPSALLVGADPNVPTPPGTTAIHEIVHSISVNNKDRNPAAALGVAKRLYTLMAVQYASVLNAMSELKESDGNSMLYHSAVMWVGELPEPNHTYHNHRWIIAGQLGGYLKTNRYFDYSPDTTRGERQSPLSVPSNGEIFTTVANGMGVPTEKFGHPDACRGEWTDIKA